MRDKVVDDFFHSAIHYCGLIENFNSAQASHKLKILLVSILDLYSKALFLPEIEPFVKDEVADFDSSVPQINFHQYDLYWKVFNPYQLEKPVAARYLNFKCKINRLGRILWTTETCYPAGYGAVLNFEFESDQSYLQR